MLLQDPDASNEEMDELVSGQFEQLGKALGDAVPAVRAAAVTGICTLLNNFWELIPAAITAGFLKRIAGVDGSKPLRDCDCSKMWPQR